MKEIPIARFECSAARAEMKNEGLDVTVIMVEIKSNAYAYRMSTLTSSPVNATINGVADLRCP